MQPHDLPSMPADPPADPPSDSLLQGTAEHYQDAELYDHEYRRRRDDIRWYCDLAAQVGQELEPGVPLRILELGCGTGRLLVPLVRAGHRVLGVDRSAAMLARCRERVGQAGRAAAARAQLLRADFRHLPLGGLPVSATAATAATAALDQPDARFSLIVCPFNGFMHLYTRADVERFLAEVRRLLRPGGVLAFDVTNPDPAWLGRDPTRRWARTRFRHPRTGERLVYSTSHVYDPETQIAWIRLFYEADPGPRASASDTRSATPVHPLAAPSAGRSPGRAASGPLPRTVLLCHRQFFPAELEALLHFGGFALFYRAGGFDGQPLSIVSSEQVICARVR